jgi:hypothetical protein
MKIDANFNSDFPVIEGTNVFIQWKGTDVCLDFRCECGAEGHLDSDFAYSLRCAECGKSWSMPHTIQLVESDGSHTPKDIPKEYGDWRDNGNCWVCNESSGFGRDFKEATLPNGSVTVIHTDCELTDQSEEL